jgi:hypothetical protein
MSLQNRSEMRRCGHRWPTLAAAETSKRFLAGGQVVTPCDYGCGGFHLAPEAKPEATRKAPAAGDTGPDAKTRHAVYTRDGWACVCCGRSVIGKRRSVGHRKRRSQGGRNVMPNLLTFLGLGSDASNPDDHHARIDSRSDPHDEAAGYTVRSFDDPALVGVLYVSEHGSGVLMYLAEDGSLSPDAPGGGMAA